jgi:2-polyprenyl-6-methoxyphenol hydroxylase-like FAD-dependent oxidoreductase
VLPVGRLPDDPATLNAFFWSMPDEKLDQWHKTDLAVWRGEVASIWPQTAALTEQFTQHEQLAQARYAQLTVRSPWRGRLVLIGDAGHQTSPQLCQGANMALLDAVHLADALMATSRFRHCPPRLRRAATKAYPLLPERWSSPDAVLPVEFTPRGPHA